MYSPADIRISDDIWKREVATYRSPASVRNSEYLAEESNAEMKDGCDWLINCKKHFLENDP
jgi:hypothetical protein